MSALRRLGRLAAAGLLCVSLCGCSAGLSDAYSLEERFPALEELSAESYADGFAADLCVVEDENAYDRGAVTSEAAALFDLSDRQTLYSKSAFERLYPASIS